MILIVQWIIFFLFFFNKNYIKFKITFSIKFSSITKKNYKNNNNRLSKIESSYNKGIFE